jgi:hypothetical protein
MLIVASLPLPHLAIDVGSLDHLQSSTGDAQEKDKGPKDCVQDGPCERFAAIIPTSVKVGKDQVQEDQPCHPGA